MDPAVIIAAISLVTTVAIAFVARGSQKGDKVAEDVTVLKTEVATLKANEANFKADFAEVKAQLKGMNEKLDKALAGRS